MTAITRFIEDAIKGGWRSDIPQHQHQSFIEGTQGDIRFMLLDTLAWQAVGKTRGWGKGWLGAEDWKTNWSLFIDTLADGKDWLGAEDWKTNWLLFIDALADGKDIEEALQVIE